jgi:hypothetical protein
MAVPCWRITGLLAIRAPKAVKQTARIARFAYFRPQ